MNYHRFNNSLRLILIFAITSGMCGEVAGKDEILADTNYGKIVNRSGIFVSQPGLYLIKSGRSSQLIRDGMMPMGADPDDYWKLADGALVSSMEIENGAVLLFKKTTEKCRSRYRILMLRQSTGLAYGRSRGSGSVSAGLSEPFGTCVDSEASFSLTDRGDTTVTTRNNNNDNRIYVFDRNQRIVSARFIPAPPPPTPPPCLSGICVGDEISEHINFPWIPNSPSAAMVSKNFRIENYIIGLPEDYKQKAIWHWQNMSADAVFIRHVSRNGIIFCRPVDFTSAFRSTSGHLTRVSFSTDEQGKLRIYRIHRQYRSPHRSDLDAVKVALHQEIPSLSDYTSRPWLLDLDNHPAPGGWGGHAFLEKPSYVPITEYGFDLILTYNFQSGGENLLRNPACVSRPVSID